MEQKQLSSPAMRVSIVSVSRNQREHLKRLIEQHGPRVVGMSGFRDYDLTRDEQRPDVLLVDLDQADDVSLTRIEKLLEQTHVPVLFNESTAVPTTPGPYRDDWVDNLVGKLYNLATHRSLLAKSGLLDRPLYAQTASHTLPNVLIVAHSKTRRRVLQIILAAQGIRDTTEISFEPNFIAERIEHYDALLVDEHNVSPEEQIILGKLTTQTQVPIQVCNSSTIPYSALARRTWGIQLAGKIIKISKLKLGMPPATITVQLPLNAPTYVPSGHFVAMNGEPEWGNRLSEVLAQVRTSLTHQAATAKVRRSTTLKTSKTTAHSLNRAPMTSTPRASESRDSITSEEQPLLTSDNTIMTQVDAHLAESKQHEATATLDIIAAHREIKDSSTTSSRRLVTPPATQVSTEPLITRVRTNDTAPRAPIETPARVKASTSSRDLIDATNLDTLPPKVTKGKPPSKPVPADPRDRDIERFFDFDKELDISDQHQALGEGHILNSATHDETLPWSLEEELTNPFSKHTANKNTSGRPQKKPRSLWRDSLSGIRKLFH